MLQIQYKSGICKTQIKDIGIINNLLEDISLSKSREEADIRAALVTGYANAMCNHDIITEGELKMIFDLAEKRTASQYQKISFIAAFKTLLHKSSREYAERIHLSID